MAIRLSKEINPFRAIPPNKYDGPKHSKSPKVSNSPAEILGEMAKTYAERNAVYRDNYVAVGAVLDLLHGPSSPFPLAKFGETPEAQALFNLYSDVLKKIVRFAFSGLKHVDSIHDAAVYAAIVESLVRKGEPR